MNGLTLIELCVALAVMTVLTAVMLNRVLELQRLARVGNLRSASAAVYTASTLTHASLATRANRPDAQRCANKVFADNKTEGAGTLCAERQLVHTFNGYPAATEAGIAVAAGLPRGDYRLTAAPGRMTVARADAKQPERCSFTYTQAASSEQPAAVSSPLVDGC